MKRIILRGGALLELDQVRHVLAVVKYRTFLEASFQLNRSQSSLSKSIRRLEEELGISIFERTTRRVELTPAGRDFVAYAEQMMVCYEGMLHAMEQHRSNGKRSLRVGSIYFGLHNRLAPLVANFSKLHPSMEIEIRESTTTPLLQDLHKGELDVVFVSSMYPEGAERANFSQYPEYRSHSCFRESYQIVVSRDHPFAGRSQLTYEDLADQPFITGPFRKPLTPTGSPCISPCTAPLSALFCIWSPRTWGSPCSLPWSSRSRTTCASSP